MQSLSCPICLEDFDAQVNIPLVLSCGHSFCKPCLALHLKKSFLCPIDRNQHWGDIITIPKNFLILDLLRSGPRIKRCPQHEKKLKWKCNTDSENLCSECFLAHNSHDIVKLPENERLEEQNLGQIEEAKDQSLQKIPQGPKKQAPPLVKIFESRILPQGSFQYIQKIILPKKANPEKTALAYCLTRDGPSNKLFHRNCDGKGPTVVLVQLQDGHIFGGFTTVPWGPSKNARGNNIRDDKAFLFSISDAVNSRQLMLRTEYRSMAIYHHTLCGPTFGVGYDLFINFDNLPESCSRLEAFAGPQIPNPERFLAGRFNNWNFVEVEVFLLTP